ASKPNGPHDPPVGSFLGTRREEPVPLVEGKEGRRSLIPHRNLPDDQPSSLYEDLTVARRGCVCDRGVRSPHTPATMIDSAIATARVVMPKWGGRRSFC